MKKHHNIRPPILMLLLFMLTLAVATAGATAGPATTEAIGLTTRVSVASDGAQGNSRSFSPSISADGRYGAFSSRASNLAPGDTNDREDVFVHDRVTGETTRVSVASDGAEGTRASFSPSISGDGRYVAYQSFASNLVPGDTNGALDVFVHDRATGETTRVSVASDGAQGNGFSGDSSISGDGRYVAFSSWASNLAPGDTNNTCYDGANCGDIFVHDRTTEETTRVSVASDGAQGNYWSNSPSISGDGRYVAFESYASNLVPGDMNDEDDVFVHDRATGETTRVSVASDGAEGSGASGSPSISGDGRYVAFASWSSNLVPGDTNDDKDVFVHDRTTGETTRVSVASDGTEANKVSWSPSISGDGRYVVFASDASNLVPEDKNGARDIFVHDRTTGETTRVSVASDGAQGNGGSGSPGISVDGRYVAFSSRASNLVPGDTNGAGDAFVRDRTPEYGVALSGYATRFGAPGTVVTHSLTLHNVAIQADTYDLALSGGGWPAAIDGLTTVALASGASSEVGVVVSVPAGAKPGTGDTVTLSATSQGNPDLNMTADLTTVAPFISYLPFAANG